MDDVLVARIGKPHGLRGEVTVRVHTDSPAERFVKGTVFTTDPDRGVLTLRSARVHNGIQLLAFDEATDRTAAEELRGTRLHVAADEEDDAYYEDDLVGLAVVDTTGTAIGTVAALHTRPAQDLLEVEVTATGSIAYIPFVEQLVPQVDLDTGRVVVDPPPGLLDLGE